MPTKPAAGRAQRYPLELTVRFRSSADSDWHSGSTENISASGAIIRARTHLMPATFVEVVITFPSNAEGAGACLVGEGRVVRSFSLLADGHDTAFAVAFTHASLERSNSTAHR